MKELTNAFRTSAGNPEVKKLLAEIKGQMAV
jgi:hypothetical protein